MQVRKVAVLRANAIGDFIFALPALEALRAAFPRAEIVLLGRDWHPGFLDGRPGPLNRVVAVPPSRGVHERPEAAEDSPELQAFFEQARRENFDIALQMHGGGRYSNPFVRRLGARLTAGLKAPDAIALDRWVPYVYFQPEILRLLEVVGLVGARPVELEPRLAVTEKDLEEAERAVPPVSGAIVVLNPGAGDGRRRWPVEKFAQVGDALAAAGAHVVVHGTEWERPLVEGVTGHMCADAQAACGSLSLGGLAGLLSRARLVISNDSGPLHIAAAVGAATVGIYWCGNLITAGPMTRRISGLING
jgi:ADP-heptose:LPS heptosyltransferase